MSSVQDAIDVAKAALVAVNWITAVGEAVTIDATPGKAWTLAERRAQTIVQVVGGGSEFELFGRQVLVTESPLLLLVTMRHIGFDTAGALNTAGLTKAEDVAAKALKTVCVALTAGASSSVRFTILRVEKPERYDGEQLLKGEFFSAIALTLKDGAKL